MKIPKAKKLPSGRWNIQVMVDGKRASITAETEKECIAQAAAYKAGMIDKERAHREKTLTLNDALTKYIEDRSAVLSPSTIRSYKETQKNRIQNLLAKRVKDIQESDLQIQINEEAQAGRSAKTIKNDISLAISVLQQYKPINAKRLKYPQRVKREHAYLDADQCIALITACEGDVAEVPILLGLWLGLRRSEILGLCWDCIDLEGHKLHIHRTLVRDENSNFVLKPYTKTESSRRTLSLPGYIEEKICQLKPEDQRQGQLFETMNSSFIYDRLRLICKKNNIPFPGVHGLRHTNASVMLSLGIVDKVAMARGGWSTEYTLKSVYQHLFQADKRTADELIDDFFTSKLQTNLQTK